MADTPPPASSPASTPPSSAAEQARIRKERREAKIRAGGSARLNKITGLGGGIQRDAPPQPTVTPSSHADPDEVDISQHFYEPTRSSRLNNATPAQEQQQQQMNDAALRQMMLGFDPAGAGAPPPGANPFAGFPGMEGMGGMPEMPGMGPGMGGPGADDPMMQMLQQMMGGIPGEGPGGIPTFPGMPGQGVGVEIADPYAYLWRIVHAIFALGLGLYIAFMTPFTGSRISRESPFNTNSAHITSDGEFEGGGGHLTASSIHFFWIFATIEVVLQTSRFFVEKGRVQPGGIIGMIMGFLPEPYKGYLAMITRYGRIWTTVSSDAMVCVFVLGVCAWWRGS